MWQNGHFLSLVICLSVIPLKFSFHFFQLELWAQQQAVEWLLQTAKDSPGLCKANLNSFPIFETFTQSSNIHHPHIDSKTALKHNVMFVSRQIVQDVFLITESAPGFAWVHINDYEVLTIITLNSAHHLCFFFFLVQGRFSKSIYLHQRRHLKDIFWTFCSPPKKLAQYTSKFWLPHGTNLPQLPIHYSSHYPSPFTASTLNIRTMLKSTTRP